jgi:antirestriction protein ArdC
LKDYELKRKETFEEVIKMLEEEKDNIIELFDRLLYAQCNPITKTIYKGYNRLLLNSLAIRNNLTDNRWLTFNQIKNNNWKLKKGSKSVKIEKWSMFSPKDEKDKENKSLIPFLKYFDIFNAKDIEGIPEKQINEYKPDIYDIISEQFKETAKIQIIERDDFTPYFDKDLKYIKMPLKIQFKEPKLYLKTLVSLLSLDIAQNENKELRGIYKISREDYNKLLSELSTIIIFKDFNFDIKGNLFKEFSNSLKKWLPIFKDDYRTLYGAIKDAQEISDLVMKNYNN